MSNYCEEFDGAIMIVCDVKGQEDSEEFNAKLDKYDSNRVRLLKK